MSFSGLAFIFHFLPVFLIAYYLTPVKHRGIVMLVGSLVFYGLGNPIFVGLLAVSVLINYFFADRIHKGNILIKEQLSAKSNRKAWLICALIYNVGMLVFFKYVDFAIDIFNTATGSSVPEPGLGLPLGISFYTFQMMSFVIDMYRGKYEKGVSLLHFSIYATMFPQITSGPLVRYDQISDRIEKPRKVKAKKLEQGAVYFVTGLTYKVLLADNIAAVWSDVWRSGPQGLDVASAWFGAWGYSMEIYFDFFGYSLMAMGLALMLGYALPDNFKNPYATRSMTAFWRTWHMTLGRWFRDYIYIPLGGSRNGAARTVLSLLVVWLCTGLWHGATINYVIWGLFLFAIVTIEKLTYGKWMERTYVIGHLYMILLIPISWTIFHITDLTLLSEYLMRMVGLPVKDMVVTDMSKFASLVTSYWWLMLIGAVCCTPYPMRLIRKFYKGLLVKILLFVAFWACIYQIALSGSNPFIYFAY